MNQGIGSPVLPRRFVRGASVAATGLALAMTAAACSSGPSATPAVHRSPRQAVLASVAGTESASSAAIGISVSVKGTPSLGGVAAGGTPVSVTITGHGVFSFANKTGEMTITSPSLGTGGAGTVQILVVGNHLYVGNSRLSSIDGGKPWVEVNLGAFQKAEGQSANPLGSLADGDPTQILGLLRQLSGSVTDLGAGQVDGVPTTEYQGQIDLAGGGTGSAGGSALLNPQMARALGLSDIPVDVWVDSAGRARQLSTTFSVIGLTVTATSDFGSFGTPVSVTAPPSDQVADGSGLLKSGQLGTLFGNTGSSTQST